MEQKEIIEQIKKADLYIAKKKLLEADNILDKLLKVIKPIEIDKYGKVMDFNTQLEFVLYCNMDKHKKISWTRNFLSEIYILKGTVQFESRKFKDAISYYEKALRWNPVCVHIYNEILEACINAKDIKAFDSYFEKAIKVAIRPIDIAMLYKKLGFIWIEKGDDELAYNLILYSKLFFPRKEADTEIAYLEKKFGTKLKYFPDLGAIRYLEEKGFAYKIPNYIIPTYAGVIKLMENVMKKEAYQTKDNYLRIIDYYHGLYFYNPTAEIHSAMLSLQREYEQKYPRGEGET